MNQQPVYWECTIDDHDKFWAASIMQGPKDAFGKIMWILSRRWGAIGTKGQSSEEYFPSGYEAQNMLTRLIKEKESKGYRPIF